jgi:hypothetical protein
MFTLKFSSIQEGAELLLLSRGAQTIRHSRSPRYELRLNPAAKPSSNCAVFLAQPSTMAFAHVPSFRPLVFFEMAATIARNARSTAVCCTASS